MLKFFLKCFSSEIGFIEEIDVIHIVEELRSTEQI